VASASEEYGVERKKERKKEKEKKIMYVPNDVNTTHKSFKL